MATTGTKRSQYFQMPLAVLVLAVSVINWGTEYKASLYPRSSQSHLRVATAKLLSETERAASARLARAPFRAAPQFIGCRRSAWSYPWRPRIPEEHAGTLPRTTIRDLPDSSSNLFYRPPPF